jgi:hypothetical protein
MTAKSFEMGAVDDPPLSVARRRSVIKACRFDYWWKMPEYRFQPPSPKTFSFLVSKPDVRDRAVLERYVRPIRRVDCSVSQAVVRRSGWDPLGSSLAPYL